MGRRLGPILLLLVLDAVACAQWSAEVERGVAWLVARQRDDGAFAGGPSSAGTTAVVTLAMLSAGHEPDLGRHGLALRRAIDFLQRELPQVADPSGSTSPGDRALVLLSLLEATSIEPDTTRRRRQLESLLALARSLDNVEADDREAREWIELARGEAARVGLLDAIPATRPAPATRPQDAIRPAGSLGELLIRARRLSASRSEESPVELASTLRAVAERQDRDGGWTEGGNDEPRRVVATAKAVLALSLPSRHLPWP